MTVLQLEIVLLPALDQGGIQLFHNILEVNWSAPSLQTSRLLLLAPFLDQPGHLGLRVAWRFCCLLSGGHLDHLLVKKVKKKLKPSLGVTWTTC